MPRRRRAAKNSPSAGATSAPRFGSGKKPSQEKERKKAEQASQAEQGRAVSFTEQAPEGGFAAALRRLTGDFASRPERFFTSSDQDSAQLLDITKELYLFVKSQEVMLGREFSALPELYTEGLDLEQIWEELQLQNRPTLGYMQEAISRLDEMDVDEEEDEEESDDEISETGVESVSGNDSDDSIQFAHGSAALSDDLDDSTVTEKMLFDDDEAQQSSDDGSEDDDEDGEDAGLGKDGDESSEGEEDSALRGSSGSHATGDPNDPDSFFNWDDYEAFADGKEGIEHLMNVVVDDYDQLQEIHDDDDESNGGDKLRHDNNEEVIEYGIDEEEVDPTVDYSKLSYKDFFDPVAILRKKKQMQEEEARKAQEKNTQNRRKGSSDKSPAEGEGEDKEESSVGGDEDEDIIQDQDYHQSDGSGSGGSDDDDSDSGSDASESDEHLSKHEKFQRAMKAKIRELEAGNMKSRGWALNGEVRAQMRPQDSLMDADLEYTRSTKTAPVITPEVTATLEDLIKQRIKDELWDDVERKRPDAGSRRKDKELADLSTEKSKVGLGQIYAQEFEQRFLGAAAPGEEAARKKEEEILVLWKKLNHQLDALSNFHYTPKPKVKEMEVRTNVSAIQMEEVIPMGVSQASAVAPEEVQQKHRGRKGVLMGTEEQTAEERQRARRASKAARRKRRRAKEVDERAVARANPGMGNKYARKKAMEELSRARNVTQASNDDAGVQWTKSADVFGKLQAEARRGIDAIAGGNDRGDKKRRKKSAASAAFKL